MVVWGMLIVAVGRCCSGLALICGLLSGVLEAIWEWFGEVVENDLSAILGRLEQSIGGFLGHNGSLQGLNLVLHVCVLFV